MLYKELKPVTTFFISERLKIFLISYYFIISLLHYYVYLKEEKCRVFFSISTNYVKFIRHIDVSLINKLFPHAWDGFYRMKFVKVD